MIDFDKIVAFEWDEGNLNKSLLKHDVEPIEAEQVFDDEFVMFLKDVHHSEKEERFQAVGQTKEGRRLHVSFTLRKNGTVIRIISARDMSRKEQACYD